jgi:hypothetical protein
MSIRSLVKMSAAKARVNQIMVSAFMKEALEKVKKG